MIKIIFCLVFLITFSARCCLTDEVSTIDYYENLIPTKIEEAMHYVLPTSAESHRPQNPKIEQFETYDFVVVGSGPGGSVVANRLSEIKKWKILLIEAGGPETNFSIIPGMHVYLQGSRFNWNFNTTRQSKACLGMIDSVCPMPRGKSLGGTTAINGLVYCRGNKNDFDRWAAQGNEGWSYKDVLPYFIKSENSQIDGDPGYHGRGGYWNVKYHRPTSNQMTAFIEASNIVRNSTSTDYNGREELGVFHSQINNIKQYRQSASKAFLEPIMDRSNLKILTYSYVTKVVINSITKKAVGVIFTSNGTAYFVRARKEVILSAGTINSPQILMLSGIGPKEHLRKMNIPVIQDLPVGRTLYDHTLFYGSYISTNSSAPEITLRNQIKQFLNDYGPLTIALNSQGLAFYQSKYETRPNYPDFEIEINPANGPNNFLRQTLRVTDEVYDALFKNMNSRTTMNVYIFGLNSSSSGEINLLSKDPYEYPEIKINYLEDQRVIDIMLEGIEVLKEMIKTEPLQKINASLVYANYPQCRDHEMGSKDYWVCAFHLLTASAYHQSGACRMGPDSLTSVVNNKGKVHGIKGLRVVDASVTPLPLAGHPTAPTVMIGEKISDYIKLEYGLKIDPITNVVS